MSRKRTFSIFLLIFLLNISSPTLTYGQKTTPAEISERPKLVIGIVVDQMRYDYLFRYKDKFGKDGFMRLLNEGFFCENTHYNYVPTFTGPGHACIYTGATPSVNGIVANDWYERSMNKKMYCVSDNSDSIRTVGSNTTAGKMSPRNLLCTTITDELRLSTNFQSKVIGIALKDRGAILPAGHSANAAFWFDDTTGNWISSTYYMRDLPLWLKEFNAQKLSDRYLSVPWNTLLPIDQYTESTPDETSYEDTFPKEDKAVFPHSLPAIRGQYYELIRSSPAGNLFTKELAIAALKGENMGKGPWTDFLAVSFSATDYVGHQFGTNAIETEDTYLRLDQDIADFLKYIDENYGKENVLLFLTADHGAIQNPSFLSDHKIPSRSIKAKDIEDYLKAGLKKKLGTDSLVSYFINDQVYLNRNVAAKKKLNLKEVQNAAAEILLSFDGVADVITASQLDNIQSTEGLPAKVQHGYNKKRSGDVVIIYEPGIIEDKKKGTTHGSGYSYDTHVPLIWYGWKIPQGSTAKYLNTVDIAATVAAMLHIEFPNGCTGKPIEALIK